MIEQAASVPLLIRGKFRATPLATLSGIIIITGRAPTGGLKGGEQQVPGLCPLRPAISVTVSAAANPLFFLLFFFFGSTSHCHGFLVIVSLIKLVHDLLV